MLANSTIMNRRSTWSMPLPFARWVTPRLEFDAEFRRRFNHLICLLKQQLLRFGCRSDNGDDREWPAALGVLCHHSEMNRSPISCTGCLRYRLGRPAVNVKGSP